MELSAVEYAGHTVVLWKLNGVCLYCRDWLGSIIMHLAL